MSESSGSLLGNTLRAMLSSMLMIQEIDVKPIGKDKVQYTVLTSAFGKPGSNLAETLLEIKAAIYSLAPPVNMLKVVNLVPVEQGMITSRYKLVLEANFKDRAVKAFKRRMARKQKRK